jgi:two-component system cell cycle response regulator
VREPALVNLNFFKENNDTCGHHVGDLALKHLARVLQRETRLQDTVARFGGDEFAVLVRDIEFDDAKRLAIRIGRTASANPVYRDKHGNAAHISLCLGVVALAHYTDPDSTLIAADRELYAAKALAHADREARQAA